MNNRILIIDDEETILQDYMLILSGTGEKAARKMEKELLEAELFGESADLAFCERESYQIHSALQGKSGFKMAKEALEEGHPFALAFIDIRMPPGWDGIRTAKKIREIDSEMEIVLVTAYSDRNRMEIINEVGSPDKLLYIKKPFDPDEIRQLALSLTRKWNLESNSRNRRKNLKHILDTVRRIKTMEITPVEKVITGILDEVVSITGAQNGMHATIKSGEVVGNFLAKTDFPVPVEPLVRKGAQELSENGQFYVVQNIMVILLKNEFQSIYLILSDFTSSVRDEQKELLKLLMESASEVLESAMKRDRFIKNEKTATIGQIAAGIIHEINNPLTAIIGAADLYDLYGNKMWTFIDEYLSILEEEGIKNGVREKIYSLVNQYSPKKIRRKMAEHHSIIHSGADKVSELMGNIKSFSRGGDKFNPKLSDVGEALEDTIILARNALNRNIRVDHFWEAPLLAWCDLNSLKHVFLNLIINAAQAMGDSGTLGITGKNDNDKVVVSISDTGQGIPDKDMKRIFQAFYTTKREGTGLGLSIVKGIMEKHDGDVRIESKIGKGTTFHIIIPNKKQYTEYTP